MERYPAAEELARLLRSLAPQLVLLDAVEIGPAAEVARHVGTYAPGVPIVAAGASSSPAVLLEMMRAGVREFLQIPFEPAAVREAFARVQEAAERAPRSAEESEHIYSFLPAKAGVGASTVALHMASALAKTPETRVLLADFDVNSGMVGFMLKLETAYSVSHAAENAFRMDDNLWRQLVASRGTLDIMTAGRINLGVRIDPPQVRGILDYARRQYKAICLDLSGNLEKYSMEIMHESTRVFLVCTSELPSLHLAREKLTYLRSIDLADRVQIVLNRVGKYEVVSAAEVESLLGHPICYSFPNDYRGVHLAVAAGKPVEWTSPLGRKFLSAAGSLLSKGAKEKPQKRSFVEYFSLVPARYSLSPKPNK